MAPPMEVSALRSFALARLDASRTRIRAAKDNNPVMVLAVLF